MRILKNPEGPAYDLEFSPDSRWLMTRRSVVRVASMPDGDLKHVPATGELVEAVGAALAEGALIALTKEALVVIDPATRERQRAIPVDATWGVRCLAFSAKAGLVVAVGGRPHAILRWSWPGLAERPALQAERVAATSTYPELAVSPDGRWVAMRHHDQVVELRDLATGKQAWETPPPGLQSWSFFAFSPDSRRLALGSGRHLTLMDVADGRTLASVQLEKKYYRGLAYTTDGRFLAAVSHEETVKAYDAGTLALRHELAWEIGKLERVAFSPDGMLGAATGGKKAVVWDMDW